LSTGFIEEMMMMMMMQAEEVKRRFGQIDILVNNAGVVCGKSLLECQSDEIRHTIDVNLLSHFWASFAGSFSCLCNKPFALNIGPMVLFVMIMSMLFILIIVIRKVCD